MVPIPSALVIDDDSEALNAIGQVLTAAGVRHVCPARSAEDALELMKTRRFDLVIADYRLEGMDGVQFLETLRASGDLTPLLLLSGAPDKSGVIRAVSQPRVDVFGKPFRVSEFVGAINKLMTEAQPVGSVDR
jgi:DNA-binding response OmpR family regulator